MAAKAFLVVRSVLTDPSLRARFEHWYASDHLPWAITVFGAESAWRMWSETEANVHCAVYRFADLDALRRALSSDGFKHLVADYDRTWPAGVTRTREIFTLAGEP
jgi:hypothetical protein